MIVVLAKGLPFTATEMPSRHELDSFKHHAARYLGPSASPLDEVMLSQNSLIELVR